MANQILGGIAVERELQLLSIMLDLRNAGEDNVSWNMVCERLVANTEEYRVSMSDLVELELVDENEEMLKTADNGRYRLSDKGTIILNFYRKEYKELI